MALEDPEERHSQISVPKGAQRSDDRVVDFNTNIGLFPTAAITPTSPRPVEWLRRLRQAAQIPSKV